LVDFDRQSACIFLNSEMNPKNKKNNPKPTSGQETTLATLLEAIQMPELAAGQPACAVCRLSEAGVERSIRTLFAEFINDEPIRLLVRRSRGFCARHTPLIARLGDPLAVAILYSDLASLTLEDWEAKSKGEGAFARIRTKSTAAQTPCPACTAERETEDRYCHSLADGLGSDRVWSVLETGQALCVPHIEQTAAAAKPIFAATLRKLAAHRLDTLRAELDAIIRHSDYRFRDEPWGSERDAWLRALRHLRRPTD